MNIYLPAFSLCNFTDKAVQMRTMNNVRQKCPYNPYVWSDFKNRFLQKA